MLKALFKAMRPRQWTKNAFVLAAVLFDRQVSLSAPIPLLRSLTAFGIFCLLSSSLYLINDILDLEADRNHPTKCKRPIASGQLPVSTALAAAVLLLLGVFVGAYLLTPAFAFICVAYFLLILAYSKWLKHIPILDVMVIATGFLLRVAAGVTVITVERFSPWLYVVTLLLALYLGFGKRRAELSALVNGDNQQRRVLDGYSLSFLDQIITVVSSTTLISYSLYTFSAPNVPQNHAMMLTIPFVMYGIFRYLYLIHVKKAGGEPEELLLTDRPLQATIFLFAVAVFIIFYLLQ